MECSVDRNGYVTWAQFLRSIIYGLMLFLTIGSGLVAWTVSKTEQAASGRTKIEYHEVRISSIEKKIDRIEEKIDRLLERSY